MNLVNTDLSDFKATIETENILDWNSLTFQRIRNLSFQYFQVKKAKANVSLLSVAVHRVEQK